MMITTEGCTAGLADMPSKQEPGGLWGLASMGKLHSEPGWLRPPSGDLDSLNYWLDLWLNHYRETLTLDPHHLHFVSYEAYCAAPQDVLQRIARAAGVDAKVPAYQAYSKVREVEGEVSPEGLAQAKELYAEMVARSQS